MRAGLVVLIGVLWAGEAGASSFVTAPLLQRDGRSSVVVLSQPAPLSADADVLAGAVDEPGSSSPKSGFLMLSPSVISMGEPAVADENVAAIDMKGSQTRHDSLPIVIRGGVTGDAFSSAPADTVTLTSGFDPNDGAKAPETPKPVGPAEAGMPGAAPEPAASTRPPGFAVKPE
jgi:hypothetical protein